MNPSDSAFVFAALIVVLLTNTLVLSYLVLRSKWNGWKLAGVVFLMYFGVYSFLSTIEALAFNTALEISASLLWFNLLSALLLCAAFAPLSVWWLGKWRPQIEEHGATNYGTGISRRELIVKLGVLAAIAYPLIYITFGYFIAWQNPDVRLLYTGSTDILPYWTQLWNTFTTPLWFYPFQIARALIWIGLAWLVLRSSKASWWETGIIVGLNFALLMNAQHLIPNPYMSDSVRLSHFIETSSSNFLWGFLIVWVLHRSHRSVADLFHHDPHKRHRRIAAHQS